MLDTFRFLAIVAAIAVPMAGHAQTRIQVGFAPHDQVVRAGYDDLEQKDQRRLDFYAEKIVAAIKATVDANKTGDAEAFAKHGNALKSTADRFLETAQGAGLSESEADMIFHRHLVDGYAGPLPKFMVTSTGPAGVRALMSLMVLPSQGEGDDYVDSIRDAGNVQFSN